MSDPYRGTCINCMHKTDEIKKLKTVYEEVVNTTKKKRIARRNMVTTILALCVALGSIITVGVPLAVWAYSLDTIAAIMITTGTVSFGSLFIVLILIKIDLVSSELFKE